MERIKEEIKYLNEDPEFVRYMSDEDEARLLKNTLKTDEYEAGVEEGIQKGIEQQKEISEQELKHQQELNEQQLKEQKISIAKALKENNVSIDIIIKSTGLTEDEINSI